MPLLAGSIGNVYIRANRPPETWLIPRDPTPNDTQGYALLDEWLNTTTNTAWILVSLKGNSTSRGELAVWVMLSGGGTIVSLTGNSGGAVFPTAGNINIIGSGVITVVGNPGTHTLTVTPSGAIASSFITNPATGTATPVAGVLTFAGAGDVTVSAAGSTVTITGTNPGGTVTTLHTDDGHNVTATAGVINISGSNGISTTGTVGPNTVTITAGGTIAQSFPTDSGTATPIAGVLNIKTGQAAINCGSTIKFTGSTDIVLFNVTDASNNQIMGDLAGNLTLSGANNTGFGAGALAGLTTGTSNTAFGSNALPRCTTGQHNTGIGVSVLTDLTTGSQNVALGECLDNLVSGSSNTAAGFEALNDLTTGSNNQAFGWATLQGITTGTTNVACGYNSGLNYVTGSESYNVLLGTSYGVNGESNVMRLGNDASLGASTTAKTFIYGVRGVTTGHADAIAVLVDSTGQFGTVSSSRIKKDNIVDMGSYSDVIRSLRPVVFNYKEHSPETKSVGLIAEEVAAVAPQLVVYKDGEPETVKYHDLVPMLLNEFQKHCELISALQAINCNLLDRIRMLEEKNMNCH